MVLLGSICLALISLIFANPLDRHTDEQDLSNWKRHPHKMDYPVYMMQLYQSLIMGNRTDFPGMEHPVLQESDMVLSLTAKSKSFFLLCKTLSTLVTFNVIYAQVRAVSMHV